MQRTMAAPVDLTKLSFSNGELIDEILNIRIDFEKWIEIKRSQPISWSNKVDEQTIYLGVRIDNLTALMKHKLDRWLNTGEEVNVVDIKNIKTLKQENSYEYHTVPTRFPGIVPTLNTASCISAVLNNDEIGNAKLRNLTTFEIAEATGDASTRKLLGSGGFGDVYHGVLYGQEIAVKEFKSPKNFSGNQDYDAVAFETYVNGVFREILPLHCYPAENVLQLLAYSFDEMHQDNPCLIFPYMPNGSLYEQLNPLDSHCKPLTWEHRANAALGIARGLTHLHSIPIFHGDIKSSNILLDKHFEPKIGDFGTAAIMARGVGAELPVESHITMQKVCGSVDYLPDDYLRSRQGRPEVDVFSFGILLFELMSGKHPGHRVDGDTIRNIISRLPKAPSPSQWFDLAIGLEVRTFKFPIMTVSGEYKMETTTLPEQLFFFGKICARNNYRKRSKMSDILQGLHKLNKQIQSYVLHCSTPVDQLDDNVDEQMTF